ncbi:TonB-dependent receptor [Mangrovimonas yunxiaonensis]|uniref:TonB-dependent receptor n=1 Tax=Mangrovimonas yunxiaonensis TaxID=1197477 RepID=A0A084TIC4_9FLAO|nr:SusC/RagA family TonB-linked outer membrane protein [Mangrovimonas yunxiaonensis]KFB00460.1 TonB-dependent receptor [Mangrovimonas yunxiaonensis]GGH34620.1 SusC/RagA family TonB-linked outer membrane protein [Mangrovimonas yunxiaonensis]
MKTKFSGILTLFLAFVVQLSLAQEKTISGTVSDENGLPLPGVNVIVKGTSSGTQTDFDGNYSISANTGDVLAYSFVGYTTKEMTVGASNNISFSMEPDVQAIDEVVITALGIKKEEKAIGYASQQLKSEAIADVPTTNVVNSLSGKVAGVNITQSSGDIGSSSRITIRGVSTIYGNSQPLIVVDGIVMDNNTYGNANSGTDIPNGLADINPQDIESVNVLKGGAATALYGMRGTNGVVVITTKAGTKKQALGVEINSTISFSNPYIFPDYQNSYGQGHSTSYFEYVDGFGYDLGANGGDGGTDESWGPALDAGFDFIQYTSFIDNPNNPQAKPWVSNPDSVIKDFYETGITTDNTVSLSGGTDKATYRASFGLTDAKGVIYNTDLKKYNISGSVNYDLSDKWSVGFSARYIKSTSDNRNAVGYGDPDNQIGQLVWGARQVDWGALRDWKNLPLVDTGNGIMTPINWNLRYNNNPFWALDNNLHPWERNRWLGTANIGYQITDNLSINAQTGIDYFNNFSETKRMFGTVDNRNGYYSYVERNRYEVNTQVLLSYNNKFGGNDQFGLSLSGGGNAMVNKYRGYSAVAQQLVIDGLFNISNSSDAPLLGQSHSQSKINSLFGTGELSYNDYLYLNFTARNDWASVLPSGKTSIFYPSVSLSALVHDMLDLNSEALTFLKLRGSWAETGSTGPLGAYDVNPTYALSAFPLNGSSPTAIYPNTLWNQDIKPQRETAMEFGVDARFLSNRLRLDFTYYDKENNDVIMPLEVSAASGYTNVWKNAATITNKGIELVVGADIIKNQGNGLNLGVDINFGKNDNEVSNIEGSGVLNLTNGSLWNVDSQARNGEPIGVLYGPSFERGPNGQILYENGLPVAGDYKILGNSQPDWTGGLGINASFKGFNFRTLFDVKMGGEVYSQTNTWGNLAGVLEETLVGRETGVVGVGVMSDGNGGYVQNNVVVDAQSYYSTAYSQNIAESSVYDASFVKWRELSLSYSLPSKMLQNTGVQSISLGVNVRNLAILYKEAPHIDPETAFGTDVGQQGLEYAQTPSTRTIGVNLNVKF